MRSASAKAGKQYEENIAYKVQNFFKDRAGINVKTAGFGHGSDVTICTPSREMRVETKTNIGSDFGQFRVIYNTHSRTWEVSETRQFLNKSIDVQNLIKNVFASGIRDYLNQNCHFSKSCTKPLSKRDQYITGLNPSCDTGIYKKSLQKRWFNGRADFVCDIKSPEIFSYYLDKGDEFLQIKDKGLYALTQEASKRFDIPLVSEQGLTTRLRFRIKPHGSTDGRHSFTVAIKIGGYLENSNLSLDNEEDISIILEKMEV